MKQILILSTPKDTSTNKVISWLRIMSPNTNIIKICPNDIFQSTTLHEIGQKSFVFEQPDRNIDIFDTDVIWTRKWHPEEVFDMYKIDYPKGICITLSNNISQEIKTFYDYIFYCTRDVFWLRL